MAVTQKVTLYNNKFTVPPVINAVQNDTDRQIEAYFGDFTLQVGMTGKLSFIRSDGTHYEVSATLNTGANTATAELDQALTQAGVTQAQLKITDSGNVGSTFTFMIKVQPDVAGISVPQDGWSAQEFDQRLTDAENAIDAVEEDVADLQDKEYDYAPVITDTASGAIASFPDGADGYPLKECVIQIDAVQSGSGDPSPDNVRPITGWSEAKVTRTGKNLASVNSVTAGSGYVDVYNGAGIQNSITISFKCNNFSFTNGGASIVIIVDSDDQNHPMTPSTFGLSANTIYNNRVSATFNLNYKAKRVFIPTSGYTSMSGSLNEIQLELGSTATDYEPYHGQTFTISLGDTRYGGELDVTRGKLRVTHVAVDLGSLDWSHVTSADGTPLFISETAPANIKRPTSSSEVPNILDSRYTVRSWNDLNLGASSPQGITIFWYNGSVRIVDPNYTDSAAFKTAMNGVQLVYELATPAEVDLTPTEITTLLGINNVWADTGDIEVEYCADTKRYIQKLISALA